MYHKLRTSKDIYNKLVELISVSTAGEVTLENQKAKENV